MEKSGFRNIRVMPNTGFWVMAGLRLNYHLNQYKIRMIRPILQMLFRVSQKLALHLDRIDFNSSDTASFTATAEK
jgi:hypothetical protein